MGSEGYHEPYEKLSSKTRDMHRAITSLMEELEAVDWYQQRVDVIEDSELKTILAHNRDEEKEHAAMVLEWIRRNDASLSEHMSEFLNTTGSITGKEAGASGTAPSATSQPYDESGKTATVGSLRGRCS